MTRLTFDTQSQEAIVATAQALLRQVRPSLAKVPLLSNSGQQDSFRTTLQRIQTSAAELDADEDAEFAVSFWVLTLLYTDDRGFRRATASVLNWGAAGLPPVAHLFLNWIGSQSHPGELLAGVVAARRMGRGELKLAGELQVEDDAFLLSAEAVLPTEAGIGFVLTGRDAWGEFRVEGTAVEDNEGSFVAGSCSVAYAEYEEPGIADISLEVPIPADKGEGLRIFGHWAQEGESWTFEGTLIPIEA